MTRTHGPLHFEDLDPKRFEDLIRQLAYEFRPWRKLEATGRAGSDDGFDARGYEMTGPTSINEGDEMEDQDDVESSPLDNDRLWLIQCKREKEIGPKKLLKYLDDVSLAEGEVLDGILFVAPCDFSKKARDGFMAKCRDAGIREAILWGKGELEDQLILPRNDHLLFAYFGISLTIRRRSLAAEIRRTLSAKRKVNRLVKGESRDFLFRVWESPYPRTSDANDFRNRPQWRVYHFWEHRHDGLGLELFRIPAFLDRNGRSWDAAFAVKNYWGREQLDPDIPTPDPELHEIAMQAWREFDDANKAWLTVYAVIPYQKIIDIDELGDDYISVPHVIVSATDVPDAISGYFWSIKAINWGQAQGMDDGERVERFPGAVRPIPR